MENHIFVMEQRKLQFHSLKNALIVMDIQNNKISKPELYVLIWLLDIGQLKLDWHSQVLFYLNEIVLKYFTSTE